ncbi:choice-of-anchor Q domain-containing protein [Spirosoma soli]|uniref:Choice-of-anchor Q domain-containing protein n=1 Tax=Spirosoma soli TaxID=1770529 RepID=A0ABW5MDG3_9BACT
MTTTTTLLAALHRFWLISLGLLVSFSTWAQTIYVTPTGAGQQTGADWNNALPGDQLQPQLANATEGQVFRLAGGLYKPSQTGDRSISFIVPSGVQVFGGYAGSGPEPDARVNFVLPSQPSSTTLSGDIDNDNQLNQANTNNVVRFTKVSDQTHLDGVVITGGYATQTLSSPGAFASQVAGGGMYNDGYLRGSSSPVIQNCLFILNYTSGKGGAVFNDGGLGITRPTFTNCGFVRNTAAEGGAIYNSGFWGISSPSLTNCQFDFNTAASGGSMYNFSEGQQSSYYGESNPVLINCSFTNNTASVKGGVMFTIAQGVNTGANPKLVNCTLKSNVAPTGGGGAFYNQATPFNINYVYLNAGPTLYNSILWNNGGQDAYVNVQYKHPTGGSTGTGYTQLINCLDESALTISPFVSDQTLQLRPCSPAIDAGTNAYYTTRSGPSTDLAGNPRFFPSEGIIDIGAYEYQGPANQSLAIVQQPTSQSIVTTGATVQVPVLLNSSATNYAWYQDGTLLTNQSSATLTLTNVQPAQTGSYSLVATSACNSVTSTAFSLSVSPAQPPTNPPSVSVTANASRLCIASTTLLQAQVSGGTAPYTYNWTSSSGASLSNPLDNTISLRADTPGPVLVSVQLTDANNLTATATFSLTVEAAPDVSITPSATAICQGQTATLTAPAGLTYLWTDGQTTQSIAATAAGLYSVTATNSAGCSATATASLALNALPDASFTGLPTTICQTAPPVPLVPATAGGSFAGPGLEGARFNPASVAVGGPYSVSYTVANQGCVSTSTQAVSVLAAPAPPSLLTQTGQLYPGGQAQVSVPQYLGNVTLLASGCQGGTLSWSGPNNSAGTGDITVSTTTVGTFEYSVVCQSSGCSSAPTRATVVVQSAPLQVVAPLFDCATNKLTLRTTGGNGQPIEYHIPSVTQGWTSENPVTVQAKHFKKEKLKLSARQLGRNNTDYEVVKLDYQLPTCPSARQGASAEPVAKLEVRVLGNPISHSTVEIDVIGAADQSLQAQVVDVQGRYVSSQHVPLAVSPQRMRLDVGNGATGVLLLKVTSTTQQTTVKLLKQ